MWRQRHRTEVSQRVWSQVLSPFRRWDFHVHTNQSCSFSKEKLILFRDLVLILPNYLSGLAFITQLGFGTIATFLTSPPNCITMLYLQHTQSTLYRAWGNCFPESIFHTAFWWQGLLEWQELWFFTQISAVLDSSPLSSHQTSWFSWVELFTLTRSWNKGQYRHHRQKGGGGEKYREICQILPKSDSVILKSVLKLHFLHRSLLTLRLWEMVMKSIL